MFKQIPTNQIGCLLSPLIKINASTKIYDLVHFCYTLCHRYFDCLHKTCAFYFGTLKVCQISCFIIQFYIKATYALDKIQSKGFNTYFSSYVKVLPIYDITCLCILFKSCYRGLLTINRPITSILLFIVIGSTIIPQ